METDLYKPAAALLQYRCCGGTLLLFWQKQWLARQGEVMEILEAIMGLGTSDPEQRCAGDWQNT